VASAHAPIKGISGFYNGILHPAVVPAHIMTLMALGLLLGQKGQSVFEKGVPLFLISLLTALLANALGVKAEPDSIVLIDTMAIALLVVINKKWPFWLYSGLSIISGILIGLDSVQGNPLSRQIFMAGAGTIIGAGLLIFYIALLASKTSKQWQKIGIRVVASWICAASLLVITLNLAKNKTAALTEKKDTVQKTSSAETKTVKTQK
jgi:urease accessory protein